MAKRLPRSGSRPGSKGAKLIAPSDGGLPSREQIIEFIETSQDKVGKREIARAFGVKGGARIALKRVLAEMAADGTVSGNKKELRRPGTLTGSTVVEVTGRDSDGDLIGKPVGWNDDDGPRPLVRIISAGRFGPDAGEAGIGDRVLVRISRDDAPSTDGITHTGELIKKLAREDRRLLGIFRTAERGGGGTIEPIDRKALRSWPVDRGDEGDAKNGDLVRFELTRHGRFTSQRARIADTLGNPDDQRQISLIAVHSHGIPDDFPDAVLRETDHLIPPSMDGRTDLRDTPLITIDPVDARDHDDAVYAEEDSDPKNEGGWLVTVAIADVAHYVRPGTKLDREAALRGNSVYFPDRVVPMLPERISNDLCSLREKEERPCLAVRMIFNKYGEKRSHTFMRAMMRSAAKLSYQEAQAAIDGSPSEKCAPLMDRVLKPLWAAYDALSKARDKRGPLDLDLPERKILLDDEGRVAKVVRPERLDAHRLIEEMMIQANVAAAEELESKKTPVMYRVHDQPGAEKLKNLRDFLETLGMKVPHAGELKPAAFNRILHDAKALPVPDLVNEVVLRAQAQAEYNPSNIGHFGLNLRRYAHFTSPIRRYADLLVHRALIRALFVVSGDLTASGGGLRKAESPNTKKEDALTDEEAQRFTALGKQISDAERRAMAAERETIDRLIASHLADRIGAKFQGRIAGVTRSGLFVKLKDTGADGFVPVSTLEDDYYNHVEEAHALVGSRTGLAYRLGDTVEVRLVEAVPTAGALRFEMLTTGQRGLNLGQRKAVGTRLRRGGGKGGGFRHRR